MLLSTSTEVGCNYIELSWIELVNNHTRTVLEIMCPVSIEEAKVTNQRSAMDTWSDLSQGPDLETDLCGPLRGRKHAVYLPSHNASFITGLCLKPVTVGSGKTKKNKTQKLTAFAACCQLPGMRTGPCIRSAMLWPLVTILHVQLWLSL